MDFAQEREAQNNGQVASCKSKQKGKKELERLRSSINCDKGKDQTDSERRSNRRQRGLRGLILIPNESDILEC